MSRILANSSLEFKLPSRDRQQIEHQSEANSLYGLGANIKLLLKLIQDYNNASKEEACRKPQRLVEMLTILDDVKTRIQKAPPPATSQRRAELRRCNTDLKHGIPPKDNHPKKPQSPTSLSSSGGGGPPSPKSIAAAANIAEENSRLRRELSVSITARKRLEKMFSSLGKEKKIIAGELAKKVRELAETEELLKEMKAQNEMLTEKVKLYAFQHQSKKINNVASASSSPPTSSTAAGSAVAVLQERNKGLAEQLLRSLESYRSIKRRLKEEQEEKANIKAKVEEVEDIVDGLHKRIDGDGLMEDELKRMKDMLVGIQRKLARAEYSKGKEIATTPLMDHHSSGGNLSTEDQSLHI